MYRLKDDGSVYFMAGDILLAGEENVNEEAFILYEKAILNKLNAINEEKRLLILDARETVAGALNIPIQTIDIAFGGF